MKELSLEEAALAWARGKRVEASPELTDNWGSVCGVGNRQGVYTQKVFCGYPKYRFRLAPEPPAKRYRPWTPEEVPVGAFTRPKVGGDMLMIIGRSDGALLAGDNGFYPLSALLNAREHSIDPIGTHDSKRTWLPCGVEVDA